MTEWFRNDARIESISLDDRGLQYGDGLFETVAIRQGKPRLWQYHLDRLFLGCTALGYAAPSSEELLSALLQSFSLSSLSGDDAIAKIVVTAGKGQRGYGRERNIEPNVMIGMFPAASPPSEFYRVGVDTILCDTRLGNTSALAGLKTLNRLEQVLARSEVMENETYEGLTMDDDGNVMCGTMSNVFFVHDQILSTPLLERCGVRGVMRRHIIETAGNAGLDIAFESLRAESLCNVDEVFLSNSQFGALPVRTCGKNNWPVGEVTRHVMSMLAASGISECAV